MTLRICGFQEFVHYSYSKNQIQHFENMVCFRPYIRLLKLVISKGPKIVSAFFLAPKEGNRSSFLYAVFLLLEYKIMHRVQKPSDSEKYYTIII
jgi:hypothetical protein